MLPRRTALVTKARTTTHCASQVPIMACKRWIATEFGGPAALSLESGPLPEPGKGEVRVRLLATTATYTDLLVLRGSYIPKFPVPVTPGYDGVGIVDAVGDGVTDLAVGNSCALMPQHGCCSTHLVLPAKRVVNVEAQTLEKATPEKAVCVALTGVTAYQMLHRVAGKERLEKPDAAVLVHGAAGGTGAMIVELAKLAGVKTIIGTCSARNVDAVKAAGAVAIDYHTDWQTEVKSITNGRGVDAVLDAVVAGSYLSKGIACTARGGIYIAYGFTNSADPGTFSMGTAVLSMAHLALQNTWSCVDGRSAVFYNVAENRDKRPDEYAADVRELIGLIASGKLDPTVGKIWSFDQAKEALLAVESGTHRGKQVVRIST